MNASLLVLPEASARVQDRMLIKCTRHIISHSVFYLLFEISSALVSYQAHRIR